MYAWQSASLRFDGGAQNTRYTCENPAARAQILLIFFSRPQTTNAPSPFTNVIVTHNITSNITAVDNHGHGSSAAAPSVPTSIGASFGATVHTLQPITQFSL